MVTGMSRNEKLHRTLSSVYPTHDSSTGAISKNASIGPARIRFHNMPDFNDSVFFTIVPKFLYIVCVCACTVRNGEDGGRGKGHNCNPSNLWVKSDPIV